MLTATGFVNGRWQFSTPPPTESTPLDRSPKNLLLVITSATPTAVPNLVQIRLRGGLWANGWNITKISFIYLFIPFFHELTYRSDPSTDFHAWWLKRCDSRKDVPFGGFIDIASHFGGEIPQNPNFGGVNRRFQAKRAKYWKFHVIETNASISIKFCTTIETIKKSPWVVSIGAQQIQDGGRPPFWKKPLNRYISSTVWPILIRFRTMTHIGLLQRIYR